MYGMLQPVFCNALYSVLRRFVQWRFARPRYFCKVLMKNRENMEERFDFADFIEPLPVGPAICFDVCL